MSNLILGSLEKDVWRMPTTIQVFPYPTWIRLRHAVLTQNWGVVPRFLKTGIDKTWFDITQCIFEETLENGGVWHLSGHSWDIDEHHSKSIEQ